MAKVEHMNGKTGVRIEDDRYGDISILMTRNGYQWSGGTGNHELLVMLRAAIDEFLSPTPETSVDPLAHKVGDLVTLDDGVVTYKITDIEPRSGYCWLEGHTHHPYPAARLHAAQNRN